MIGFKILQADYVVRIFLEAADAVARNGSFSAAAQSCIAFLLRSASNSQLEEWLAVPLFERRHRDVELTAAGAWFLKEGRLCCQKKCRSPASNVSR